jgi:hypothetical protein
MARQQSAAMVGYKDLIGALGGDTSGGYDDEIGAYDLGLDDLSGDELSGINDNDLGAMVRRMRGGRAGADGRARIEANRIYDLGLGSVTIAPGAVGQLTGAPAIRFRVDRLFLVPTAPGLLLLDLKAGIVSQSIGGAGSPVESFSPTAIGSRMSGQTLDPAVPVILTISNPTLAAISIAGNIIGKADQ